ncbi:putative metal-dependent membrane protease [Formosa agariphila KMM 3901]|uniref:Putative metal-dependent membrane protease n=2 Tax=Formosa TaxID=225842 RepID=T2KH50_FORAG|nr:putative metal-dependent membrane protease [Formosa agariphila KMM 3901]
MQSSMEIKEGDKHAWLRVLLLIIPYFIIVGLFQLIGGFISGANLMNEEFNSNSIQDLSIAFFGLLGTFFVIWIFMKNIDHEPFINLGFQTKNRLKDFVLGIIIGLIIMVIGYTILVYSGEIRFVNLNFDIEELIISILLFIIVSVTEEMFLRGYVLRNFMLSFNKYVALFLSSVLFAAMHGFNPNIDFFALLNLFLAGILLGMSYIYTKNLWFPIGLHFSWNLFQTLLGFNVSGLDSYSIVEFKITAPNLINGGMFGFEGSYLSIVAQLITITCIVFYYNKKQQNRATPLI